MWIYKSKLQFSFLFRYPLVPPSSPSPMLVSDYLTDLIIYVDESMYLLSVIFKMAVKDFH